MDITQTEFDELVAELVEASRKYYLDGSTSLTDEEFDAKLEYLQQVAEENPELQTKAYTDLVEKVAGGALGDSENLVAGAGGIIVHNPPMLSLQKANTEGEIDEFLKRTAKFGADIDGWVLQPKLDGMAISAHYESGKLTVLATRGNGQLGEDISDVINSDQIVIVGLPKKLSQPSTGEIRGEVFMTKLQFEENDARRYEVLFKKNEGDGIRKKKTEEELHFKNHRNATAGILKRKGGVLEYHAELTFHAYTLEDRFAGEPDVIVVPSVMAKTRDEVHAEVARFGKLRVRKDFQTPTDGIVIKCKDDTRISHEMGSTAHHPSSQIAFKYPSPSCQTTVEDIEVEVGRTGRLSVRAKVTPVQIDGSTVRYATLHNFDWLRERNVRVGSLIQLKKANDIIPYVEAVLRQSKNSAPFPELEVCPICETEIDKSTLLWRCPNNKCDSRIIPALKLAVGRNLLDIEGLSEETLSALNDAELVYDVADLFYLTIEQLSNLRIGRVYDTDTKEHSKGDPILLGEKTAIKIYTSIQKAKDTSLAKILASLNIRTLQLSTARNIAKHFGSMDNILAANPDDFAEIDLIADKKSGVIYQELHQKTALIERLRAAGVRLELRDDEMPRVDANSLVSKKKFVISGEVPGMTRNQVQELIESLGGETSGSVSSKTDYLVADEASTTGKVVKAKQLGVEIITAERLLEMLNSGQSATSGEINSEPEPLTLI